MTDGLYGIITVKIPEPQFEGQTKGRLGNSYVRGAVEELTYNYLKDYFAKNVLAGGVLPGKLADCSKRGKHGTELYIVEGDSA